MYPLSPLASLTADIEHSVVTAQHVCKTAQVEQSYLYVMELCKNIVSVMPVVFALTRKICREAGSIAQTTIKTLRNAAYIVVRGNKLRMKYPVNIGEEAAVT